MLDTGIRLGLLLGIIVLLWLVVRVARFFVERQRRAVLALPATGEEQESIRILSFSTPDCRQCQTLQSPALERLKSAYGAMVNVVKIDAVEEPALAQQYRVMTVPSTVVLDMHGQVQAVNYGFAPTQRIAEQIDALLK
ncbi:MAG TPA: thioredoxin family protein [Ktedonobacteraceae bacterium]|jgi:hypothetical protein